jgi:hypothetical protein
VTVGWSLLLRGGICLFRMGEDGRSRHGRRAGSYLDFRTVSSGDLRVTPVRVVRRGAASYVVGWCFVVAVGAVRVPPLHRSPLRGEEEQEGGDGDHGDGGGDEDGARGAGYVDVILAGDDKDVGGDGEGGAEEG